MVGESPESLHQSFHASPISSCLDTSGQLPPPVDTYALRLMLGKAGVPSAANARTCLRGSALLAFEQHATDCLLIWHKIPLRTYSTKEQLIRREHDGAPS